jgi:hypothetical protein
MCKWCRCTKQTVYKRPSEIHSVYECIGTAYMCICKLTEYGRAVWI